MKKKVISYLLAGMAVATLIGCGSSSTPTSTSSSTAEKASPASTESSDAVSDTEQSSEESSDTTAVADKITLFQSKVEIADQLEEAAQSFTDETGIDVEIMNISGDNQYDTDLVADFSSNNGPTVFSVNPGSGTATYKNYMADLSDLSIADKVPDSLRDEVDGKLVGIPYTVEGIGLMYNKNLYDPSKITNTDELIQFMQEEKKKNITGVGLSQEDYFLIVHILNTAFAVQDDPDAFLEQVNKGEVKMADTKAFQELAQILDAIRSTSAYNPVEESYDQAIGDFASGQIATLHQGNWAYPMFTDYNIDFEMGLAPLPLSGNNKLAVAVPNEWAVNSQASPEEQAAGKKFIEWLYTSDTGIDYLMNKFSFIPVLDGMTNENLDPLSKCVADAVASDNVIGWPMNRFPKGIQGNYLAPLAQKFFTTDMSADEFLKELDEQWATAVANIDQ